MASCSQQQEPVAFNSTQVKGRHTVHEETYIDSWLTDCSSVSYYLWTIASKILSTPKPSLGTTLERIAAVESDGILDLLDDFVRVRAR